MKRKGRKAAWLLLIATAGAAALLLGTRQPRELGSYAGKNLLLVSIDTLRPDHLGAYGYPRSTSPAIDRLAARGILFEEAFAPRGMTWPSLATMLTSLAPTTTNVRWNAQYLAPGVPTLAGLIHDSGYRTGAFLGGSICHLARSLKAFDRLACGDDDYITGRSVEFFRSVAKGQPFFAWLHLMAPHAPYDPPAEHDVFTSDGYRGPVARDRHSLDDLIRRQIELDEADLAQLGGLYDGEVRYADAQVRLVLEALEEQGLASDTIVVLVADHGEELYEHHRYLYHACSIYDSVLKIPMILALPDQAGAGTRFPRIVEMADLAPTLLELLALETLPTFEGRSLVPMLAGRGGDDVEAVAESEWYDPNLRKSLQTVRTPRWRYISNPEGLTPQCVPAGDYFKVAREELYDHDEDAGEGRNVVSEHPELAPVLARLTRMGREAAADYAPMPVDPRLEEELRSLGYVE